MLESNEDNVRVPHRRSLSSRHLRTLSDTMKHYNYAQAVMSRRKVNDGASTSRQAAEASTSTPSTSQQASTSTIATPPPPYQPLHSYDQPPPQPPVGTPAPTTSRRPPPFDTPPPPISLPPRSSSGPQSGLMPFGTFSVSHLFQNRKSIIVGPVTEDGHLERPAPGTSSTTPSHCRTREVWAKNLHQEFQTIRQVVQDYSWVAMDTEFPGVVARLGDSKGMAYQYHTLRMNVDLLRLIQLGITFMDGSGKMAPGISTWQFNFKFSLTGDTYAQQSIDHLRKSGLKFKRHEQEGIDHGEFAELLMTSGLVLIEDITWLSFHAGFDFAYLYKLLTTQSLPLDENEFLATLRLYFPNIYDVKHLMKKCKHLTGGLQDVANQLQIRRLGIHHQAGSDSQVTGQAFFKIKEIYFDHNIEHANGQIYGLRPLPGSVGDDEAVPSTSFGEPTFLVNFPEPAPAPAVELYRRPE